ncbi:hypothetical protein [Zobellella endophytica]|uniref:hypothetical protein n=1 Tax=Zobellella endophytica TaxID=2116700 RepID=UPI001FE741E4|nr:hypothetical protein [Zobellella endophytica]
MATQGANYRRRKIGEVALPATLLQFKNRANALATELFIVQIFIGEDVNVLIRMRLLDLAQKLGAITVSPVRWSDIKLADVDSKAIDQGTDIADNLTLVFADIGFAFKQCFLNLSMAPSLTKERQSGSFFSSVSNVISCSLLYFKILIMGAFMQLTFSAAANA